MPISSILKKKFKFVLKSLKKGEATTLLQLCFSSGECTENRAML